MTDCKYKNTESGKGAFTQSELRRQLDQLDGDIMELLIRRMELSASMATAKKGTSLPIFDRVREQNILKKVPGCCCSATLENQRRICTAGIRVYEEILRQSRRIQARELLPPILFLAGPQEAFNAATGAELAELLGFSLFDTNKEWPAPLPEEEIRERFGQLLLQKEWVVCCRSGLLSDKTIRRELQQSDSCIFIDASGKDGKTGIQPLYADFRRLPIQEETPAEAAEKIAALLRTTWI